MSGSPLPCPTSPLPTSQEDVIRRVTTPIHFTHHQMKLLRGGRHTVRQKTAPQAFVVGVSCLAYLGPTIVFGLQAEWLGMVMFAIVTIARCC